MNELMNACRPLQMPAPAKAVLMHIADRTNSRRGWAAWPSIAGICEATCFKRTAVLGGVKWLASAKLLTISKTTGTNNRYAISLPRVQAELMRIGKREPWRMSKDRDPEFAASVEWLRQVREDDHGGADGGDPIDDIDQSATHTSPPDAPVCQTNRPSSPHAPPPVRHTDQPVRQTDPNHKEPLLEPKTTIALPVAAEAPSPAPQKARRGSKQKEPAPTAETWDAYSRAYANRYGLEPLRNARTNAQMSAFVSAVGRTDAPAIAEFYLRCDVAYYVRCKHAVGPLLRDAEAIRTRWATGDASEAVPQRVSAATEAVRALAPGVAIRPKKLVHIHSFSDIDYREGLAEGGLLK